MREELLNLIHTVVESRSVGVSLAHQLILHHGIMCSRRDVQNVFEDEGLYQYQRPKPPQNLHTSEYEAIQKNLIWHTDLHDLEIEYYDGTSRHIIAFMDDTSRRIMGWEFLQDKNSITTRDILKRILDDNHQPQPYTVWTNKGGEFLGHFEAFLLERGIKHHHTAGYSPQQNGKIERFWQKVKSFGGDSTTYQDRMEEYNDTPHFALPKGDMWDGTGAAYFTPDEKYNLLESWNPELRQWRVNNRIKQFD
jgi:transposase InsO family protein